MSYGIEERFNPVTTLPVGSDVVFEREEIDKLIEEINVTTAPKYTPLISSDSDTATTNQSDELKPAERETLLKTIGALAKLAAHLGGNDVGTFDKPNAIALWAKLAEIEGESLPYGLGKSTMTGRISKGCNIYKKGKN